MVESDTNKGLSITIIVLTSMHILLSTVLCFMSYRKGLYKQGNAWLLSFGVCATILVLAAVATAEKDNFVHNMKKYDILPNQDDLQQRKYNKARAVVCFVPNKEQYITELKCLYQNFEILNLWENTDLIIFHPKNFILSNKSKNKMSKIIMIQYDDVDEGTEWDGPSAAADCKPKKDLKGGGCKGGEKLRDKYGFVNSFKFLIDPKIQQILSKYKYILKTDSDIFLTPRFKNTFPKNKVMVGNGQYANNIKTKKRLKEVAKKMKYNHYNIFNVGATWYGNSEEIIKLGKLSYSITKHIYNNEFLHYHPGWDEWYIGVSSMYGSELAANHLFGTKLEKSNLIDGHASSSENIDTVLHVHCWHDSDFYSKFAYIEGKYKDRKPISNSRKINEYIYNIVKKSELL